MGATASAGGHGRCIDSDAGGKGTELGIPREWNGSYKGRDLVKTALAEMIPKKLFNESKAALNLRLGNLLPIRVKTVVAEFQ